LIQGYWTEDSVQNGNGPIFLALPTSYLRIDANLHYSLNQKFSYNSTYPDTDTGYLVFDANRNFQAVSVGLNHYLSGYGDLVISVATDHKMTLYAYGTPINNLTWYFHK
jgi:hypothetical protein